MSTITNASARGEFRIGFMFRFFSGPQGFVELRFRILALRRGGRARKKTSRLAVFRTLCVSRNRSNRKKQRFPALTAGHPASNMIPCFRARNHEQEALSRDADRNQN